jgi:hypothetical protein
MVPKGLDPGAKDDRRINFPVTRYLSLETRYNIFINKKQGEQIK